VEWIQSITKAIRFVENNLTNDISVEDVANQTFLSVSHFQRIFQMGVGITVGEYIRNRRLSLAGRDLILTDKKVIDIAMRYRYDTSESFSRAFARFHGIPPSVVKKHSDKIKCFNPLIINISVEGGFNMSRKIMEDDAGIKIIREKFEYKRIGKVRFIGVDLRANSIPTVEGTIEWLSPMLGSMMSERISEIDGYCYLEHHNGGEVNVNETGIGGYFFKADTTVPEGCIYYDIPTVNIGYGLYIDAGDTYQVTRDQILSDGVEIPYPQAYWTALHFIDGEPREGSRIGYIIGVGETKHTS